MNRKHIHSKDLYFATPSLPYSTDPLEFDSYIHHYAFTSVFGTLISFGKKGEIIPQIAESWSHDNESKKWIFVIRKDLEYSNGDKINAQDFALSLKRIAYLKRKSNSESGIFENLVGNKLITSIQNIEGIVAEGNRLIFDFKKPMPDLLSKISFGFYSLAHPSLYDQIGGEWKDKRKSISSNGYQVDKWDNHNFRIMLRGNIPYIDYENAIEGISFVDLAIIKRADDLKKIDILIAEKSTLMVDSTFEYVGSAEGFKIGYVECYGWNDSNNPMSNINIRQWLRFKFYEGLEKSHFTPTNSFFPPDLTGVKKFKLNYEAKKPIFGKFKIITHTMNKSSKIEENVSKKSIQEILDTALKNIGNNSGVDVEQIPFTDSMDIEKVMSLAINGTGIEAEEFIDTVKFMFLSKQGANLPDYKGSILSELKKDHPDIDFINKEIWNQSIIWPVRYYTKGYWFKKNSQINYDKMNLDLPSIDFQFIKWN